MCIWDLKELEEKVLPGLRRLDGKLQQKIIKIAETNEPIATYDLVEATLRNHGFSSAEMISIARSASWLSLVRRDKQEERGFERIIAKLA